jgi:hypothetical protein
MQTNADDTVPPGVDREAYQANLREFLATCDEDERVEYFAMHSIELGAD